MRSDREPMPDPPPSVSAWEEMADLFAGAVGLAEPERRRFLDDACRGRATLRAELEAMLAAAGDDHALRIEVRLLETAAPPASEEGRRVGAYRLLSLLGRGGMGEVYLAAREGAEFEQKVAVKLLRAGLLVPELQARFRAERQILARLAHPLIVPLLDGGVDEDGRPYLVMQYVEGLPITEHCERAGLSARERLRLLAAVCRAVQHAHVNLVVHRDIKPSNILVTADGAPRLLDFGIAKLLATEDAAEGGAAAAVTQAQLLWLTPERAAPEQRRGEPVTTATDVYALGVLLVELLTGALPTTGTGGGGDGTVPRALRGDLQRIAAKALDPEPARRYASAGQLGEDLDRYLAGQPVLAQPDRWSYRARKFVRRHLAATVAVTAAAAALLAFAVTAAVQARRIAAERDRVAAEQAKAAAEAAKANEIVSLLVSLFEESDPTIGPGGDTLPVGEFLARARQRVGRLRDQPEVQARLEQVLGDIHEARSHFDDAAELYTHARDLQVARAGPDDPRALDIGASLAAVLARGSERRRAEELLRELLPRQRRVLGHDHRQVSETLQQLSIVVMGEEGERFAREALAIERRRRPANERLLASALTGVASATYRAGDRAGAAALYRESAALYARLLGPEHPSTLSALSNLATSLTDLAEQEAIYRRVLAADRRVFGNESSRVADRLSFLGVTLTNKGDYAAAEAVLTEGVETWRKVGGPDHERTATAEVYLARALDRLGKTDAVLRATAHASAVARSPAVDDPWLLSISECQRARTLLRLGRSAEALRAARTAVDAFGTDTSRAAPLADAHVALGLAQLAAGSPAESLVTADAALALVQRVRSPNAARLADLRCARGRALSVLGRRDEARSELGEGLRTVERSPAALHPADVAACRDALAALAARH